MARVHQAGKRVPNYPGRAAVERALTPVLGPWADRYAGHALQRLYGFWVLWQSLGGFDALAGSGLISRAGIYAQRNEFRDLFGVDVSEWHPEIAAVIFDSDLAERMVGKEAADRRTPPHRVTAGGNVE